MTLSPEFPEEGSVRTDVSDDLRLQLVLELDLDSGTEIELLVDGIAKRYVVFRSVSYRARKLGERAFEG